MSEEISRNPFGLVYSRSNAFRCLVTITMSFGAITLILGITGVFVGLPFYPVNELSLVFICMSSAFLISAFILVVFSIYISCVS